MPIQTPQWTEYLSCPICFNVFNETLFRPISLACGHTICKTCLGKLKQKRCPFDQNVINRDINELPVNLALLQLVGVATQVLQDEAASADCLNNNMYYLSGRKCIEDLAIFLKPVLNVAGASVSSVLSRPMQRKLVALVSCQLVEEEGRTRAMRASRSLGERTVTELILQHQNPQQLSTNLWAAVRARGCQFLGPAMQEEVLKLILLALEDGSALSRKVLVLFVVQRLEVQYPQASKTAIGHVVQLLYRASCFMVTKRNEESSLMQLKEEFRVYEMLRREHDTQIVQIATEAGLRISPEQWSSLLYGDTTHKSHMQSIIDKLQTPQSFPQSIQELVIALQRTGDPGHLTRLQPHLDLLSSIDPMPEAPPPSWENLEAVLKAIRTVVQGLVDFMKTCTQQKAEPVPSQSTKYKTSLCRDLTQKGSCPRGANCTFAHSQDELDRFRARHRKLQKQGFTDTMSKPPDSTLTSQEHAELAAVTRSAEAKLLARSTPDIPRHTADIRPKRMPGVLSPSCQVPVAKAMPMLEKGGQLRHMIYSSPTIARVNPQPEVIPITGITIPRGGSIDVPAKVAVSTHATSVPTGVPTTVPSEVPTGGPTGMPGGVHTGVPTGMPVGVRTGVPTGVPTTVPVTVIRQSVPRPQTRGVHRPNVYQHVYVIGESPYYNQSLVEPPAKINAMYAAARANLPKQYRPMAYCYVADAPVGHRIKPEGCRVLENAVDMMSLPPNPYTEEYYAEELEAEDASQGNASEHLEILHRRKKELIQQLQKSSKHVAWHKLAAVPPRPKSPESETDQASLLAMYGDDGSVSYTTAAQVVPTVGQAEYINPAVASVAMTVGVPRNARRASYNETELASLVQSVADSMATSQTTQTLAHMQYDDDGEVIFTMASSISPEPAVSTDCYPPWSSSSFDGNLSPENSYKEYEEYAESIENVYDFSHLTDSQGLDNEYIGDSMADDDEFIPFSEHTTVSKYGPISRLARGSTTKNTAPLQVTAALPRLEMTPVTAITPMNRPYPVSVEVPSQYGNNASPEPAPSTTEQTEPNLQSQCSVEHGVSRHHNDPQGLAVAASLPTALMQPSLLIPGSSTSLLVSGLPADSNTMWNLKEKMLNMPGVYRTAAKSTAEREQIRHELVQLTKQIDNLELSEHERLARELHSVEMNIQEAELLQEWDIVVAHAQEKQTQEVQRHAQEVDDRRMAQCLALEEASIGYMADVPTNEEDV